MGSARDVGEVLRTELADDLRDAQRQRDRNLVRVLRSLLGAIDNGGAVAAPQTFDPARPGLGHNEVERRSLDAAALRAMFVSERREREQAVTTYREHGQHERADTLATEVAVIERYLRHPALVDGEPSEA